MRHFYILIIYFFISAFSQGKLVSQTVQLGSGTDVSAPSQAGPVNIYFRKSRLQIVYSASELSAAGLNSGCIINSLAWFVESPPIHNIPDYTIKIKHTSANNASSSLGDNGWTTVKSPFLYAPASNPSWDELVFDDFFLWNGTDNLAVEVCWSQVQPNWDESGQTRVYNEPDGMIFIRNDSPGSACVLSPDQPVNYKPQVQFNTICSTSENDAGVSSLNIPSGNFCPGMQEVEVTIRNFGVNQINTVDINWTLNGITQSTVTYNNPLDTAGGANPSSAVVSLGTHNLTSGTNEIVVWTSMPNGVQDTTNSNDTLTAFLQPSAPSPRDFTITELSAGNFEIEIEPEDSNNLWIYAVAGANDSTPNFTLSNTPIIQVSGLDPGRAYNVFVAELCPSGTDTSQILGPKNIQTDFVPNTGAYVFTTAGSEGRQGPDQNDLNQAYSGTNLDGNVTSDDGIQLWSPPFDGDYRITAVGAGGGNALETMSLLQNEIIGLGGAGSFMSGTFSLTTEDTLKILVGQKGADQIAGSGGGGTFVTLKNDSPLVVAGGGGGAIADTFIYANNSLTTNTGTLGGQNSSDVGGGGGLLGDGQNPASLSIAGNSFISGGEGGDGEIAADGFIPVPGGFGGGGSYFFFDMGGFQGESSPAYSGPGGGYSGGSAFNANAGSAGGGSFNIGSDQNNIEAFNRGDGSVIVEYVPTQPNDVAVTAIDSPTAFCPGPNDIVVTISNLGTNQVNSFDVEWSVDGVSQSTASFNLLLDTIGGSGSSTSQVNLGSFNFSTALYSISAHTLNPNGQPDSDPSNDTTSITVESGISSPTDITTTNITGNSTQISWTPANASNNWIYSVVPEGQNPDTGILINSPSVTITGLDQLTTYDFYVREVCALGGDTTAWTDGSSFTTGFFCPPNARCFSTANNTGNTGPNQALLDNFYQGTNLEGKVTSQNGIQLWNVPATGKWRLTAMGASGGTVPRNDPGFGAYLEGTFELIQDQELGILVGQQGESSNTTFEGGGGGGGSFIWSTDDTTTQPLIVAGGGAGGGNNSSGSTPSKHGDTLITGGSNGGGEPGGTNGQGGDAGGTGSWVGGGGAGWLSNGGSEPSYGNGGLSPVNGGQGGSNDGSSRNKGGFGGGGSDGYDGGGGYSGGRGGGYSGHSFRNGGGGGSYNTGTDQINQRAFNGFAGYITMQPICVQPDSLQAMNVEPSSATIYWSEPIDGNNVELVWGPVGFNPRLSGNTVNNPSPNHQLSGLDPGKNYDVYLRTDCQNSEYSPWIKITFSTPFICGGDDYCFQTAGSLNDTGPTQALLDTFYTGTNLENSVISNNGVQQWTVPAAGTWRITARGAAAGVIPSNNNGLGVEMEGTFDLGHNQPLSIIVGQQGQSDTIILAGGGGGGASFVWETGNTSNPLIAAGGGGGGGNMTSPPAGNNIHAVTSTNGQANGEGLPGGTGGDGGPGGASNVRDGGGGGGWNSDGGDGSGFLGTYGLGGQSALNGGLGGDTNSLNRLKGGFGGGGSDGRGGGGGGGGYSGGSGGENYFVQRADAGGGGSFNDGNNQNNTAQANDGPGVVILSPICISPINLSASNVSTGSADLTWNEIHNSTEWEVSYGTSTNPDSGIIVSGINSTSTTLSGLTPATQYSVFVRSVCSATETSPWSLPDSFTTGGCAAPELSFSLNPSSCGLNNGEAVVNVTGGIPPYSYNWSTNGNTQNVSGLAPNTNYTVTVTDSVNCETVDTIQVQDAGTPIITLTATGTIQCTGESGGAISASVSSGSEPYSYQWSTSDTGNFITGLFAGMYRVTVTDSLGCAVKDSLELFQPNPITTGSTIVQNVSCNGGNDGEATITATGGTGTYSYAWSDNGTGSSRNDLIAGNYIVTVTDDNNCEDTVHVNITEPPVLNASATVNQNVSCNGGNDGEATISATGGTGTYSYSWSDNGTGSSRNDLIAGNYIVTVEDANNCEDTVHINITEPPVLSASATVNQNVSCNSGNDGEATISATGGTGTYSYAWSDNGTGNSRNDLIAGNYIVTLSDANNCEDTVHVHITEPPVLSASAAVNQNVSCNSGNDGEATISATGGTGTYSYAWSDNGTGNSRNDLIAGNYIVTVTDDNNCEDTVHVNITEPPVLSASATVNQNVSCNGGNDGEATISATGGTGTYSYAWSDNGTGNSRNDLIAGNYIVTVSDANNCEDTVHVNITEPPVLSASAAVNQNVSCNGGNDGEATISATGGTGTYSYAWSDNGTGNSRNDLIAGNYIVTLSDDNNCEDTVHVHITEPTVLSASAAVNQNVSCNGGNDGEATITATGGTGTYTYAWSDNATGSSRNDLIAGNYIVTVTDDNNCEDTVHVNITEPPVLSASATVNQNVSCNGGNDGEATITATGGTGTYSYAWSDNGTGNSRNDLIAGNYIVTVTDDNNCEDTVHVNITEPPVLSASATVNQNVSCNGGNDGEATISATGGTGTYTYSWPGGLPQGSNQNSLSAGNYSITIEDANNCQDSVQLTITEPAALALTMNKNSNVTCFGGKNGSIQANVTGGTTPYTYQWSNGSNAPTAAGLDTGSYTVVITDANGCTVTGSDTITGPTGPLTSTIQINSQVSCAGDSDGEVEISASGGFPPYTYTWNNSGTGTVQSGLSAGVYFVTVMDSAQCSHVMAVSLNEPSALQALILNTTSESCVGENDGTALAVALGGTPPYNYMWPSGTPTAQKTGMSPGSYEVTVTDSNGCTAMTTAQINGYDTLELAVHQLRNVVCEGGATGEVSLITSGGRSPYSYQWSNGTANNTAVNLTAGNYSATVTDANGCIDSVSIQVSGPQNLEAQISTTHVSCNGAGDGEIVVSASGGNGNYEFSWSNGSRGDSLANLSPGTYLVTVSDSAGCNTILSTSINEPAVLSSETEQVNGVLCHGDSNGVASVTGKGGTSPYIYSWSTGDSGSMADNLTAGRHFVTVIDNNGCEHVDSLSITSPQPTSVIIDGVRPVTCFGYRNGEAEVSVLGGTPPYRYNWSTGSRGKIPRNLVAGYNTVTVTDANGCESMDSVKLETPQQLDTSVTQNLPELIVNLQHAQYRWVNCETNEIISNESGRSFIPPENGFYKAVIFARGCADTTQCFEVLNVSSETVVEENNTFQVYPNPNAGNFSVRLTGQSESSVKLDVLDMQGKLITSRELGRLSGETVQELNMRLAAGVYFVKIILDGEMQVKRVVVQ